MNITSLYEMYKTKEEVAEEKPISQYWYRWIFNYYFNLSFGVTKTETHLCSLKTDSPELWKSCCRKQNFASLKC